MKLSNSTHIGENNCVLSSTKYILEPMRNIIRTILLTRATNEGISSHANYLGKEKKQNKFYLSSLYHCINENNLAPTHPSSKIDWWHPRNVTNKVLYKCVLLRVRTNNLIYWHRNMNTNFIRLILINSKYNFGNKCLGFLGCTKLCWLFTRH